VPSVPFADVGGVNLYYETEGAGPRVLFISGTGDDLRHRPTPRTGVLAESFEVLCFDQRGLGQSDVPPGPYSMAQYGDDAAALLDAVGWDDCMVVGVSFGGMVAQELTLRHPAAVRRLVLACTSAGGAGGASYPLQTLLDVEAGEQATQRMTLLDTRWDEEWQAANADMVRLVTEGMGQRNWADPEATRGLRLQLEARSHHDTSSRLGAIACPTFVCGGRFDGIAPQANSEFLASHIPGARLELFDGGHIFFMQDPAAWPAIVTFLSAGGT
jgi:3-oxoadipate enol-lactonase